MDLGVKITETELDESQGMKDEVGLNKEGSSMSNKVTMIVVS